MNSVLEALDRLGVAATKGGSELAKADYWTVRHAIKEEDMTTLDCLMDQKRTDYERGYEEGYAKATEQSILNGHVDINGMKIKPEGFGKSSFISSHSQGWNDCLDHISSCGYRIVR